MRGFEHDRHAAQLRKRMRAGSIAAAEHPLIALQQAAGNAAVTSALQRKTRPGAFDPSNWPRLAPHGIGAGPAPLTRPPDALRGPAAQPAEVVRDAVPPAARMTAAGTAADELLEERRPRPR